MKYSSLGSIIFQIIEFVITNIWKVIIAVVVTIIVTFLHQYDFQPCCCCKIGLYCQKPRQISQPYIDHTWVAYSPTHYNPNNGLQANAQHVREDLQELSKSGFSGLFTYTANGVMGKELPEIAKQAGFKHLIVGIYDPLDANELNQAVLAAKHPITEGFVMGNEGLYPKVGTARYSLCQLREQMNLLRSKTNKPVTTSEDSSMYLEEHTGKELLGLGDWLFPNAHPYWAGIADPQQASAWTEQIFKLLSSKLQLHYPDRNIQVIFKEVGLPTEGSPANNEQKQKEYYSSLCQLRLNDPNSEFNFVHFEAFDQTWKDGSVEKSWGLFRHNRLPKLYIGNGICKDIPPPPCGQANCSCTYVYKDAHDQLNSYRSHNAIGDVGDVRFVENSSDAYQNRGSALKISYTLNGQNSNCNTNPCRWTGVELLGLPSGNYSKLHFAAKSSQNVFVKFELLENASVIEASSIFEWKKLTQNWEEYSINLPANTVQFKRFLVTVDWVNTGVTAPNNNPFDVYVDEVRLCQ